MCQQLCIAAWGNNTLVVLIPLTVVGELGLGGSSKNVCTPSRMPWARDAAWLAAACGGRFAALLDSHNRLFTWGAGVCAAAWPRRDGDAFEWGCPAFYFPPRYPIP